MKPILQSVLPGRAPPPRRAPRSVPKTTLHRVSALPSPTQKTKAANIKWLQQALRACSSKQAIRVFTEVCEAVKRLRQARTTLQRSREQRGKIFSSVMTSFKQVKDYQMASVEEYIGDSGKEFEVRIHSLQTNLFQLFSRLLKRLWRVTWGNTWTST